MYRAVASVFVSVLSRRHRSVSSALLGRHGQRTHPWQAQNQLVRRSSVLEDGFDSALDCRQRRVRPGANGMVMPHVVHHQKELIGRRAECAWRVRREVATAARGWGNGRGDSGETLPGPSEATPRGVYQRGVALPKVVRRTVCLPVDRLEVLQDRRCGSVLQNEQQRLTHKLDAVKTGTQHRFCEVVRHAPHG